MVGEIQTKKKYSSRAKLRMVLGKLPFKIVGNDKETEIEIPVVKIKL